MMDALYGGVCLDRYGVRPSQRAPRAIATEYPLGVVHAMVTLTRLSPEEAQAHVDDLLARDFAESVESESATDVD